MELCHYHRRPGVIQHQNQIHSDEQQNHRVVSQRHDHEFDVTVFGPGDTAMRRAHMGRRHGTGLLSSPARQVRRWGRKKGLVVRIPASQRERPEDFISITLIKDRKVTIKRGSKRAGAQEWPAGGAVGWFQSLAHLYGLRDLVQGLLSLCVAVIQGQSSPVQSLRRDQFFLLLKPWHTFSQWEDCKHDKNYFTSIRTIAPPLPSLQASQHYCCINKIV